MDFFKELKLKKDLLFYKHKLSEAAFWEYVRLN